MKAGLRKSLRLLQRRGKRNENKERTRRAILKAALGLFAEKGFYHTTTKAISRKAKIADPRLVTLLLGTSTGRPSTFA